MKEVLLRMNEDLKYITIKDLVDHNGNKHRAALKLSLSVRQVNRLISVYKEKGKAGFVHGNRNRQPPNSTSQELVIQIIQLYLNKYYDYNYKHFTEMLSKNENIYVSYKSVYRILTQNSIYTPKEHRATKRKRAKNKLSSSNTAVSIDDIEITVNHEVAIEDSHPRKSRSKYFGELIQMDASIHRWFSDSKTSLHLAIDNASGIIVGGYFDKQETLLGYYNVYKQILEKYGIPAKFLTDNRTIFNYTNSKMKDDSKDVLTQFGYACKILGTSIETSSVSQYKGQIERANGTFQGRLVNELRTAGIDNIDDANAYLLDVFIPDFNNRFAMNLNNFISVMDDSPSEEKINLTLAIISSRKFDNGSSISYNNVKYQAYDENDKLVCFKPKTDCLVIKSFDNNLFITVDDKVYSISPLILNKEISDDFDTPIQDASLPKKKYSPSMTHPWKKDAFISYKNRAHSLHQFT